MHIIIAVLGAVAGVIWALSRFMSSAREGKEVIDDVRGVIRRGNWSRRVNKRLIENLSDPREAAAIVMLQTASYEGIVTEAQQALLLHQMMDNFQIDRQTAEEMLAFARMALGEITDASNSLSKILRPVRDVCTDEEKHSLLMMMRTIAEHNGTPSDQQNHIIEQAKHILMN